MNGSPSILGKPGQVCRFRLQFGDCFRGCHREPAGAAQGDFDAPREENLSIFETYRVMASGATWVRNSNGEWHLVKSNDIELESAVRELIKDQGLPICVFCPDSPNYCINISTLAALLEFGIPLDMERLKHATQPKCSKGNSAACCGRKQSTSCAKCEDCRTRGDSPNSSSSMFQTLRNGPGQLLRKLSEHFKHLG